MSLKRACWCRRGDDFVIRHLKSVRKDGSVLTDEIKEFKDMTFGNIDEMLRSANGSGYCVVGELSEIVWKNRERAYRSKCGSNQMAVDEL